MATKGDDVSIQMIERSVREGIASYAAAMNYYWPAFGQNEVSEANQVLHIGSALRDAGWHVYGEVPLDAGKKGPEHVDMLALEPAQRVALWCECKRVWHDNSADSLASDIERLLARAKLSREGTNEVFQPKEYCLVVASTWAQLGPMSPGATQESFNKGLPAAGEGLQFWRRGKAKDVGNAGGFSRLQTALAGAGATLGSVVTYDDAGPTQWGLQRVLYAIFEKK